MKRIIAALLAFIMLPLMVSCAHTAEDAPESTPESTPENASESTPEAVQTNKYEDFDNRFLPRSYSNEAFAFVDTEEVLYFNRKYLVKETGECGYLCAKPDCTHASGDEECGAYWVMGYYDGKLYCKGPEPGNYWGALYSEELDGTDKQLVYEYFGTEDNSEAVKGHPFFHRGKLYYFYSNYTVVNAEPFTLFQVRRVVPNQPGFDMLLDEKVPYSARWHLYFKGNYIYVLFDHSYRDEANEVHYEWELRRFDIDEETWESVLTDDDAGGENRGFRITEDGEIWAVSWPYMDDDAGISDITEDIVKLVDGHFVKQWQTQYTEEEGSPNSEISEGVIVTYYSKSDVRRNPDLLFKIRDFEGSLVCEGKFTPEELREEHADFKFESYELVWADENELWMQQHFQKLIIKEDGKTYEGLTMLVIYKITENGFEKVFSEYDQMD